MRVCRTLESTLVGIALCSALARGAVPRLEPLRASFTSSGVQILTLDLGASSHQLSIALVAFGREGTLSPPLAADPALTGDRIDFSRGELVEWYTRDPRGLEQGFTLARPPAGTGELVFDLEATGTLTGAIRAEGIDFSDSDGVVRLRYDHLEARDADGRLLASRMSCAGRCIQLRVDDDRARYPIVVDPLASVPAFTLHGDQGFSRFGVCVASAGDADGDGLSDVLIGASFYSHGQPTEGRAFEYTSTASGFGLFNWSSESNDDGSAYGSTVACAGDVNGDGRDDVIVGAPHFHNGTNLEGRVWLHLGTIIGPSIAPSWTFGPSPGNPVGVAFGISVASAGDVNDDGFADVIVGALGPASSGARGGAPLEFHGSAAGLGTSPAWTPAASPSDIVRGESVACAGDVNADGYSDVIIGDTLYDNGQSHEGRASVYLGSAAGLATTPAWSVEGNQVDADLGASVASAGDVNGDGFADVIVGAPRFDGGNPNEGRASIFLGSVNGPQSIASWSVESDQDHAHLGASVASAQDVNGDGFADVLVGAPLFDAGQVDEGVAYAYFGSPAGPATTPSWIGEVDQAGAEFGSSVASFGDKNGDGFADVVVGAPFADGLVPSGGAAFIYLGSCDGFASATPFGIGKPGSIGTPSLTSTSPPALGTVSDLTITGGRPATGPVFVIVGLTRASIPFDGGTLLVTPTATVVLPALDGTGSLTVPVPLVAGVASCGASVYFQAMFVDPGAAGFNHTAQSNGLHWILGG